jgi:uncharacterized membrane protein
MTDLRPDRTDEPTAHPRRTTVTERDHGGAGLRVFQLLTAAAGAVLFVFGLLAIFRADFDAGMVEASAAVAGFAFSPLTAVAAILLGGAVMVAALADQDRGAAGFLGLLTLVAGVVALVVEGEIDESIGVDRRSALLFVGIGAIVFVLSLVPWWTARRRVTADVR